VRVVRGVTECVCVCAQDMTELLIRLCVSHVLHCPCVVFALIGCADDQLPGASQIEKRRTLYDVAPPVAAPTIAY
jgi:hypothetical protein